MAERMGANGLPIVKKVKTWEDLQNESAGTLQEILEVNPNSSPVEEVEDEVVEEVDTTPSWKRKSKCNFIKLWTHCVVQFFLYACAIFIYF